MPLSLADGLGKAWIMVVDQRRRYACLAGYCCDRNLGFPGVGATLLDAVESELQILLTMLSRLVIG
ncbi:hypothetical protein D3C81_2249890 [compost metagenome]